MDRYQNFNDMDKWEFLQNIKLMTKYWDAVSQIIKYGSYKNSLS